MPFVRPVTKFAATAESTAEMPGLVDEALRVVAAPHSGPAFVDFPLDHVFSEADEPASGARRCPTAARRRRPDGDDLARASRCCARPSGRSIMAGHEPVLGARRGRRCARSPRSCGMPVFLNGLARGCVPADHGLRVLAARSAALKGADVALVVGVPMDFRLGFGGVVRRGDGDRRDRPRRADARASAPGRRGALRGAAGDAGRAAHPRAAGGADTRRVGRATLRARGERRAGEAAELRRRPRAAAPDAALRASSRRCSTATRS